MPQFHSLRSFQKTDGDDQSGERSQDIAIVRTTDAIPMPKGRLQPTAGMTPIAGLPLVEDIAITGGMNPVTGMTPPLGMELPTYIHQQPLTTAMRGQQQSMALQLRQATGQYAPVIVHDARTNTQSLVLALQSSMKMQATGRAPVLIPAEKKRVLLDETEGEAQHLHLHLRHILAGVATLCIFLFTMFSLTPMGSGQSGIAFLDGAVSMVHMDQANWSLAGRSDGTQQSAKTQPAAGNTAGTTSTAPVLDTTNLPMSQYVAIAQADATNYGISPTYFVRQINQESGFNPYAVSPVGAVGIAQFMPGTAAGMGVNPYDPISSLDGAARMMANLSNEYGGNYAKALAAYNAGSGNVNNAVAIGGANWLAYLPAETQNYVAIIMG